MDSGRSRDGGRASTSTDGTRRYSLPDRVGLEIGARLKHVGISSILVERNTRVGDNWRDRYETLCLHDPVCESHISDYQDDS